MPNRVVNGIDWHYEERGTGTPLVLLHAFPLDHRLYQRQTEDLSKDYRVICPDLPGFGRTPWTGPITIPWYADQVHALLKEIGALPCILGGCSMGGYATFAFERECPTDVLGVILIDTRAEGDGPDQRRNRDKLIEMVDRHGPAAVADAMIPKMLADQSKKDHPELEAQIRSIALRAPAATLKNALAALRDRPDVTEFLPSVASPALVIVGAEDQITPPAAAEQIAAGIRHATLEVIPGAGHLAPIEAPEAVNAAIRRFAAQLTAGK
jgi:pimeloyl-ACP methyl ester carboxylesterase